MTTPWLNHARPVALATFGGIGAITSAAALTLHAWHGQPWQGLLMAVATAGFVLAVLGARSVPHRDAIAVMMLGLLGAVLALTWVFGLSRAFPLPDNALSVPVALDGLLLTASFITVLAIERGRQRTISRRLVDERQMREALETARREAQDANLAKSAFLANMSHELRTPLSAVSGLLDLAVQAHPMHELELAQRSTSHLIGLVSDILDLSKIESGDLELKPAPTDVAQLVQDVVELARMQAQPKGVKVKLELDLEGWSARLVDRLRLKQVLHHLVNNAVKFTEQGAVQVRVHASGEEVEFLVLDSGIGMAPDQIQRVMQAFHQVESSSARVAGGSGVGLTLAQNILERMGSRLQLDSEPGHGTRVAFVLHLRRTRLSNGPALTLPPTLLHAQTLRILVAEDNPLNQLIARRQLEAQGHEIGLASDGVEAVEAAFAGWDLILMDVQMPRLDGRDATRQIRALELEQRRSAVPIVALTANAMHGDEEACLAAGMDGFLPKPLDLDQLDRIMLQLAARRAA